MKLTPQNVQEVVRDSLFREDALTPEGRPKNPDDLTEVRGIVSHLGFDRNRLEKHRQDVISMLEQLPDGFKKGTGDGWSFLNLCEDKDGRLWTGMHKIMDELCCLAIGLKIGAFLPPDREMWSMFPGGLPYVGFDLESGDKLGSAQPPENPG